MHTDMGRVWFNNKPKGMDEGKIALKTGRNVLNFFIDDSCYLSFNLTSSQFEPLHSLQRPSTLVL